MAGPIRIAILANASQARREMSATAADAEGMGSKITSTGKKLAAGFAVGAAVAGAAAVKFGADAVKSASNAQQSLGATRTVFGEYAGSVIANSKKAATAIGLSANEYRELSNVTGALLSGAGMPLQKVAGLTDDLNKRAADMAATFGGTTREAVEAISSLMKGEADPIERYGVSIKQSDVSARLAAQGLDGLTGSALKQAEMQARLELLTSKTAKTQGAFKRESGTLANQQQVLAAQFENVKAKIGTVLLPVLTGLFAFINTSIIPAVERMLPGLKAWASEMGDRLGPVISTVAGFVTGTLAPALSTLAAFVMGTVVPAVTSLVTKVASNLAPVLTALVGHAQRIVAKFREWQPAIQTIVTGVGKMIGKIVELASAILGKVLPPIIRFTSTVGVGMVGAAIAVVAAIVKAVAKVIEFGGSVLDGARKVGEFAGKVKEKIADVVGFFTGLPGKIKGALSGAGTMLVEIGKNIIRGLVSGLETAKQWVIDKIQEIADVIPGWVKKRLGIASPARVMIPLGKFAAQGLANGVKAGGEFVVTAAKGMADKLVEAVQKRIDTATGVRDAITSLRDQIAGALTGDLFGGKGDESGTALSKFRSQLEAARALAEKVRTATADLIGKGVSSEFLKKLTASGNTELIVELSGASDAAALAKQYEDVLAVNAESGLAVAEEVIGARLDDTNQHLLRLADEMAIARAEEKAERQRERAEEKAERQRERAEDKAERQKDREEARKPKKVRLSAQQVDQVRRGRETQADLDAYYSAGGRAGA